MLHMGILLADYYSFRRVRGGLIQSVSYMSSLCSVFLCIISVYFMFTQIKKRFGIIIYMGRQWKYSMHWIRSLMKTLKITYYFLSVLKIIINYLVGSYSRSLKPGRSKIDPEALLIWCVVFSSHQNPHSRTM